MKIKRTILGLLFFISLQMNAIDRVVNNIDELSQANRQALPGDCIILKNKEWSNVTIVLTCHGTKEKPIVVKAETAGKVIITGRSWLRIGGDFLVIDGLHFMNGFSGSDPVLSFRSSSQQVANHCRITNTVINNFNNPQRLEDNYWISLYGKNNRIDHCTFIDKKNLGVLLAVHLDDDRSRENNHQIDHNYFGKRVPLASNAGEIIRIGVSEHCQYNSNTQIIDNLFEYCDGEGEIISIKSGQNCIRNNIFKECQGSVVLRHGNYNTIENNIFLGNNKEGTGGVRVINKGQLIVNNFFYKCRGTGFRSPFTIMNGVPNSPANRYLEVSDAIICNNSFFECTPISFCEGSDAERSVVPHDVFFGNNLFYQTGRLALYNQYDAISKIKFSGNRVSETIPQQLTEGFVKVKMGQQPHSAIAIPTLTNKEMVSIPDSIKQLINTRLSGTLSGQPGLSNSESIIKLVQQKKEDFGASWYQLPRTNTKPVFVHCKNAQEVLTAINNNKGRNLQLTLMPGNYVFENTVKINCDLTITTTKNASLSFQMRSQSATHLFEMVAGNSLTLKNVLIKLEPLKNVTFVSTDTSGNSSHSYFVVQNCIIENVRGTFFHAARTSVCDSLIVNNTVFRNGAGILFNCNEETDNKGYYNIEKFVLKNTSIINHQGSILSMLRSGKDESTLGPRVWLTANRFQNCVSDNKTPLLAFRGVQFTTIAKNSFMNCNKDKTLIEYVDWVRAQHLLNNNSIVNSGAIQKNEYVKIQ